jgi:serine/threonine protein kinase
LDLVHQEGILHNDIRKENIVVDESGNPYLIDFGDISSEEECLLEKMVLEKCIENL